MDSKVAIVAATPDPTFGQKPAPPRPDTSSPAASVAEGPDQVDLRLVIEEDKASNSYVYKTVDRRTGKVIQQLPREQVLQLREQLEAQDADLATCEAARFIVDNEHWGDYVVLTSDKADNMRQGKYIRILGKTLYKIDSFTSDEVISFK